eukprot:6609496-Pyramimonas_sp.AAC.1
MSNCLRLGTLLGRILGAPLGASWAVWRPSRVSSVALGPCGTMLSSLGSHLERSWNALGAVFGALLG